MRVVIASGHVWPHADTDHAARAAELAEFLQVRAHRAHVVMAPPRRPPAFRRVGAWLVDPVHERDVAVAVRADAPDLVHVLGCGAGTSTRLAWIAHALGASCSVEVDAAHLLCHRGDLLHADGEACTVAAQPAQCAACCRRYTPGRGGLSRSGAALAWAVRVLGDASPFPTELTFRNRRDLMIAALQDVDLVVVRDQAGDDAARALGVDRHKIATVPDHDALLRQWTSLAGCR